MKKARMLCNIDMLRLRCTGGDMIFEVLKEYGEFRYVDGKVIVTNYEYFKRGGDVRKISASVWLDELDYAVAELAIEANHYTHIRLSNQFLYSGMIDIIHGMVEVLCLQIDAIERLDLALDCNVSLLSRLRRMVRNTKEYDMLINGKKVKEDEACLLLIGELSRKKANVSNAMITHKNSCGLQLRVYDKAKEIDENSDKQYIRINNQMEGQMHRLEIAISEKFINSNVDDKDVFLDAVLKDPDTRMVILRELSDKIIRFNAKSASMKKKADIVSLLDLIY